MCQVVSTYVFEHMATTRHAVKLWSVLIWKVVGHGLSGYSSRAHASRPNIPNSPFGTQCSFSPRALDMCEPGRHRPDTAWRDAPSLPNRAWLPSSFSRPLGSYAPKDRHGHMEHVTDIQHSLSSAILCHPLPSTPCRQIGYQGSFSRRTSIAKGRQEAYPSSVSQLARLEPDGEPRPRRLV